MSELHHLLIASTASICLLVAIANAVLAARAIGPAAAKAFVIAFLATGTAWILSITTLSGGARTAIDMLTANVIGAVGTTALWCAVWLRAGVSINWWYMGALTALWIVPAAGVMLLGWRMGMQVPFATLSLLLGLMSCVWCLHRKRQKKNAGDVAMLLWLLLTIPAAGVAHSAGLSADGEHRDGAWIVYLVIAPTLYTGMGVFSLLSFTLEAIYDVREQARTDGLTGLLNRRAFDSDLEISVARADRSQRELSLIVLDIDNFKQLNDSYGHPTGDLIIQDVACVLRRESRQVDRVARIGGEEFALILADTDAASALHLAERIRTAISSLHRLDIDVTASFGIASTNKTDAQLADGLQAADVLRAADRALYAAKAAGRNCVRHAVELVDEPKQLQAVLG